MHYNSAYISFVGSTYYVPLNNSLPRNQQHRIDREGYYQVLKWLPNRFVVFKF